jgi:hypothetical protein
LKDLDFDFKFDNSIKIITGDITDKNLLCEIFKKTNFKFKIIGNNYDSVLSAMAQPH